MRVPCCEELAARSRGEPVAAILVVTRWLALVLVIGCVDQPDEPIVASAVITIEIPLSFALSQASPCLPTLADADPDAPGAQDDCAFALDWRDGGRTLVPCAGDGRPCWQLVPDPQNCVGAGERALELEDLPADLPVELYLRGQCVVR
jgi:hypothetical protein